MTSLTATPAGTMPPGAWKQAVVNALLRHGTLTRAEIAELTGISRVSASGLIDQLIHAGYVRYIGKSPAGAGGPSARTYSLARDCAYSVGVALTRQHVTVMTTNVTGDVVSRYEETFEGEDAVVPAVEAAIRAEVAKVAADSGMRGDDSLRLLRHVVLGTSGVMDPTAHELAFAVDRPEWKPDLPSRLRAALGRPVIFENDVNLAALAEARVGAGSQVDGDPDLVLVWLDDGVACGAILGGRVYRGAHGWAGEISYQRVLAHGGAAEAPDDVRDERTDRAITTLQRAAGIRAIAALAKSAELDVLDLLRFREQAAQREQQKQEQQPDDARGRQPELAGAHAELARRVALAASGPVFVFDPDLVVLAGEVVRGGGDALLDAVRAELAAIGEAPAKVVMSQTGGDAIVTGAMLFALDLTRDSLVRDTDGDAGGDTRRRR